MYGVCEDLGFHGSCAASCGGTCGGIIDILYIHMFGLLCTFCCQCLYLRVIDHFYICPNITIRFGLIYGEEVYQLRNVGEWSNMIGCRMGFSPIRVYTTVKTSLM